MAKPASPSKTKRVPLGFNEKPTTLFKKHAKPKQQQKFKHNFPKTKEMSIKPYDTISLTPKQDVKFPKRNPKNPAEEVLDRETERYLNKVLSTLKHGLPSESDTDILANNVFSSQYAGQELLLANNNLSRMVLRRIFPHLSHENVKAVLLTYQNDFNKALKSSEMIAAMEIALQIVNKLESEKVTTEKNQTGEREQDNNNNEDLLFFKNWFSSLSVYFADHLDDILGNQTAFNILETFLIWTTSHNIEDNKSEKRKVSFPSSFSDILKTLVDRITPKLLDCIDFFIVCQKDKEESDTLFKAKRRKFYVLMKVLPLLKLYNEEVRDTTVNKLMDIAASENENYITQAFKFSQNLGPLLRACSNKQLKECLQNRFKGRIGAIAAHPKEYSILYPLISCCRKKYQIKIILEELLPEFSCFILVNKYSKFLQLLSKKCLELGFWQKAFVKNLMMVLHCFKPKKLQLRFIELLLLQTPYNKEMIKNSKIDANLCNLELIYLLKNLFHFKDPEKCAKSFLALETNKMVTLACTVSGISIIKAFLTSQTVAVEYKTALIHLLKGSFLTLAYHTNGSTTVQELWSFAANHKENSLKVLIAEELLEEKQKLRGHISGQFVYHCCDLNSFDKKKKTWAVSNKKQNRKRKILDMINFPKGQNTAKKRKISTTEETQSSQETEELSYLEMEDNESEYTSGKEIEGYEDDSEEKELESSSEIELGSNSDTKD